MSSILEKLTGRAKPAESVQAPGNGETLEAVKAERDQLKEAVAERDKRIQELEEQVEQKAADKSLEAVHALGLSEEEEASIPQSVGTGELKGRERMRVAQRKQLERKGYL